MAALIYDPFDVNESNLTFTNLTESTSEWDVATTYDAGDEVHVVATKMVYVSAIDGNVGNDPVTSDATTWIIKGAMNKWAAFDAYVSNPASGLDSFEYRITVDEVVNGVSLFALEAGTVEITVSKDDQSTVYSTDLLEYGYITGSWYNWFTGGRQKSTEFTFSNLAYYGAGTEIKIALSKPGGTVSVGQISLGRSYELGSVLAGVDLRTQSFTRYTEDEFGNLELVKRPSVTLYDLDISIDTGNVARTQKLLKSLEGVPTVFIGSETPELGLIVFGVLVSSQPTIPHHKMHTTKITFRELL